MVPGSSDFQDGHARLRLVNLETFPAKSRNESEGYPRMFDEICFTTSSGSLFASEKIGTIPANALCYHKAGSQDRFRPEEEGRCWILQFQGRSFPDLIPSTPADPSVLTRLTIPQAATFKHIFARLFSEFVQPQRLSDEVMTAWFSVLVVEMRCWIEQNQRVSPKAGRSEASPELMRLHSRIIEHIAVPGALAKSLQREIPNYDSLRHAFRQAFGVSPKKMLLQRRMEEAKRLLQQTGLSIKDISNEVGYSHQHEFARAFRHLAGSSPTEWRDGSVSRAD